MAQRTAWALVRFSALQSRAKRYGIPFTLVRETFALWYEAQVKACSYCGLTLAELRARGIAPCIDRKDNGQGYCIENITLACFVCNRIKTDVLSFDDMLTVGVLVRHRLLALPVIAVEH